MPSTYAPSTKAKLSINAVQLDAYLEGVKMTGQGKEEELILLGDTPTEHIVATPVYSFELDGVMHPTAHTELAARLAARDSVAFIYQPQGSATGDPKATGNCRVTEYSPDTSGSKAGRWKAKAVVNGTLTWTTNA